MVVDDGEMKRRATQLIGVVAVEVSTSHERPQFGHISILSSLQQFLLSDATL